MTEDQVCAQHYSADTMAELFEFFRDWAAGREKTIEVLGLNWAYLPFEGPEDPPGFQMSVFYYDNPVEHIAKKMLAALEAPVPASGE